MVNNLTLGEQLALSYRVGKHTFGIRGSLSWLNSRSAREGYDDISAFDITAGANATLNLPMNWQITTDLNLYNRSGYSDHTLNTTNWVWNASVAKTILKGNLTFRLNAVDILKQISIGILGDYLRKFLKLSMPIFESKSIGDDQQR